MKTAHVVRAAFVWTAVLGFCLPQSVLAAEAAVKPQPVVADVALLDGGLLLGQVIDPQGTAAPEVPVSLQSRGEEIATATTDTTGCFVFRGLHDGVYQIAAVDARGTFRLWAPGVAPPSAQPGALMVAGGDTLRGQNVRWGDLYTWLANPWVIAGIVVTAVAVPVAINNSRHSSSH